MSGGSAPRRGAGLRRLFIVACLAARAQAHWVDDPRYPEWAERGRIIYLDQTEANEKDLAIVEALKAQGATPFIHAFTPHWPDDRAVVDRLSRLGIPVDVRVEASLFFEDDHIDRFAFIHGPFFDGGWWYNHAWRTNYDWYRLFPESIHGTTRKRNGDERLAYAAHHVTIRREGARFWADAWADYYLWRKRIQDDLLRERGKPFCLTAGNFSFVSQPHGTIEFYWAKKGIVDMPGPSEYVNDFCRGRFHFLIKTMLAATHGRPAGKFYPSDLTIAESLAVSGVNTYRPAQAEFLATNADLYGRAQPGGRIAILFSTGHNLVESHLCDLLDLADQIAALGHPYEGLIEDDLERGGALAEAFPLLVIAQTDLTRAEVDGLERYLASGGRAVLIGECLVEDPRHVDLRTAPPWTPRRTVESLLSAQTRDRVRIDRRQSLPPADLDRAIESLGGAGFKLEKGDPDLLLNVLRQPNGELTLLGLVNYSGRPKTDIAVRIPAEAASSFAGWISRDGGAGMLEIRDGRLVVPEIRYGCTCLLGGDRTRLQRIVERNAARFPRPPLAADVKLASALTYGEWRARELRPEDVAADRRLCRHRVGATDRAGYLFVDVVAPRRARAGEPARFDLRVVATNYDYVEYWQLILEETSTGERAIVPIALPANNPHGAGGALAGTALQAQWSPKKAGTYQAFLAYRVTRLTHDGEPFLGPENVPAGYSGNTPANLFLKSQPLMKRPCEDRLRGIAIEVE